MMKKMTTISIFRTVIGSLGGLGALLIGSAYGYAQLTKGRNAKIIDDFNLFNTQIDALKKVCDQQAEQIAALQNDIKSHSLEIGRLQGINEEKDRKIKELNDMLSNRDPALQEHIKESKLALNDIKIKVDQLAKRMG